MVDSARPVDDLTGDLTVAEGGDAVPLGES